jgi:hypothetical protein
MAVDMVLPTMHDAFDGQFQFLPVSSIDRTTATLGSPTLPAS